MITAKLTSLTDRLYYILSTYSNNKQNPHQIDETAFILQYADDTTQQNTYSIHDERLQKCNNWPTIIWHGPIDRLTPNATQNNLSHQIKDDI